MPVTCDADLVFSQVTPATQGGVIPSQARQLEFDSALDFYTPTGATRALSSLGLQLLESPVEEALSSDEQSLTCELHFGVDEDFVT